MTLGQTFAKRVAIELMTFDQMAIFQMLFAN
jgi:hypothetical protein